MNAIRLVHWKAGECPERLRRLQAAGYAQVDVAPFAGPPTLRQLAADPPLAVVIDLGRLPSQGREVGVALRVRKGTRGLPLVFVDGAPDKVERVRQVLPDAVFTTWPQIGPALEAALASAGQVPPVAPDSVFAAYAGRPLAAKLGIREGAVVALVCAPEAFPQTLGELPAGASLRAGTRGRWDLMLWFVRSAPQLQKGIAARARGCRAPLWILWPKKGAGGSDLTQRAVRAAGLAAGLVDYKICAVDETWSGLLFRAREG